MSDIKLTEAQAKDRIEEVMQILKVRQMCMDDPTHEDVVDYRERYRALQMAVEALEKQIPKRPNEEHRGYVIPRMICPSCDQSLGAIPDYEYCPRCGQAIDWTEVE